MGEDLAVPGIGRLRTEDDRRALGAAEDFVEQRQLHLAVAGTTQVRSEVGGPQPAFLDDLLQRWDQRLPHRVVEVVGLLDDQVNWLTFRTHELVDPFELLPPIPGQSRSPKTPSSFRTQLPRVLCGPRRRRSARRRRASSNPIRPAGRACGRLAATATRARRAGTRKAWRRRGLRHAVDLDERLPRDDVRMARRLSDSESTGAAQHPGSRVVCSHSSRDFCAKRAASASRCAAHAAGTSSSCGTSTPRRSQSSA